jgi:hypothetical protein
MQYAAENNRNQQKELEQTFKIQIKPFLQTFLNRTQQSYPINVVINMRDDIHLE